MAAVCDGAGCGGVGSGSGLWPRAVADASMPETGLAGGPARDAGGAGQPLNRLEKTQSMRADQDTGEQKPDDYRDSDLVAKI